MEFLYQVGTSSANSNPGAGEHTGHFSGNLYPENPVVTAELDKAVREASEARPESRAAREEIRQAKEKAAGKPFLLQTKFGDPDYA